MEGEKEGEAEMNWKKQANVMIEYPGQDENPCLGR